MNWEQITLRLVDYGLVAWDFVSSPFVLIQLGMIAALFPARAAAVMAGRAPAGRVGRRPQGHAGRPAAGQRIFESARVAVLHRAAGCRLPRHHGDKLAREQLPDLQRHAAGGSVAGDQRRFPRDPQPGHRPHVRPDRMGLRSRDRPGTHGRRDGLCSTARASPSGRSACRCWACWRRYSSSACCCGCR